MFIEPMLAAAMSEKKRPSVTFENGYHLEAKHDGVRAIVTKIDGKVEIYSRTANTYSEHFPKLVEQFMKLPDGTILDGELMVSDSSIKIAGGQFIPVPNFHETMRILGSNPEKAIARQEEAIMKFYAYDILLMDGIDLISDPYESRTMFLTTLLKQFNLSFVDWAPVWGPWDETTLDDLLKAGIEGAIMKHKDSTYYPGKRRANTWYKFKAELTADVVVMGFTEAKEGKTGKFKGLVGAIIFGAYNEDGELVEVGQCSGMTDEVRKYWTDIRDAGEDTEGRVIEIKYNDTLATGTPRHPQYRAERLDKRPKDCLMSQFDKS